ncbi:uncharacterized protein LOC128215212 [Mya arenaria]|uniref:uncharacterized protein LOC128215212 n=1 Tax=Mya arenaria TaxID=6604 RepID=UPI0022E2EC0C|nr:uncharacterized protein LOC128215212 [Mya arenaria]
MILKGYEEAESNSHTEEEFCLQHINLKSFNSQLTQSQRTKLKMFDNAQIDNVGFESEDIKIFSKLKCVKELDLVWSKSSLQNGSPFDFEHLSHLEYLINLKLRELPFSDVGNLQLRNLQQLAVGFRTPERAPQLMAALLQEGCDSLTTVPNWQHFILRNLWLENVRMPAEVYRRLVSVVVLSGHSVFFMLERCTIEFDITQVQKEMGNQPALQVIAPQAVSPDYTTSISLHNMTMPAEEFLYLVSVVIQSGHYGDFTLINCTIECDIEQVQEEMGNQPALQVIAPQAVSSDYTQKIGILCMKVSAEVFRRLLLMVIQSRHIVECQLKSCKINPDEEVSQLQEEMGNQPAIHVIEFSRDEFGWNITLINHV